MGFSVGGEYTGVIAYLLEGARPERRGLVASLAAAASEVGALLAVGVSAVTVSALSEARPAGWGWRIPFLVGAALAGTVWLARSTMEESPDFERLRAEGALAGQSAGARACRSQRGGGAARLRDLVARLDHLLRRDHATCPRSSARSARSSESAALWLSTIAAVAVILVTPVVGLLSDRFGRKPGAAGARRR